MSSDQSIACYIYLTVIVHCLSNISLSITQTFSIGDGQVGLGKYVNVAFVEELSVQNCEQTTPHWFWFERRPAADE